MGRGISQVVLLVVAVLVAGALMVVGFNVLKKISTGTEGMWSSGEEFQKRIKGAKDIYEMCDSWSKDGFPSDTATLKDIGITKKMRLYPALKQLCAIPLENAISLCEDVTMKDTPEFKQECVDVNNLFRGSPTMTNCITICNRIVAIGDECAKTCSAKKNICFVNIIDLLGKGILDPTYFRTIIENNTYVTKACAGQLMTGACAGTGHGTILGAYYPEGYSNGTHICSNGQWQKV